MAPHSSTLAWKISQTEDPGGLQSMGSLRVGHDRATSLSLSCIGEGNGNPLQCSCLETSRDGGGWWAAVYGVSQSRTWLNRLSSSSSIGGSSDSCNSYLPKSIRQVPPAWAPSPFLPDSGLCGQGGGGELVSNSFSATKYLALGKSF